MQALQPGCLFGITPYQGEQGAECRLELLTSLLVGLKKPGIAGEQESAKTGFFIHHQFDQVVDARDDTVGMVNLASASLHLAKPEDQGQRQ